MSGWRSKFLFLLIVYFAGFATAIYILAPAPGNQVSQCAEKTLSSSAFKSDEFVQSFNGGMHKCLDFGKDAAWRVGKYLKQKLDEKQLKTGS
jgi:hypothetical protein